METNVVKERLAFVHDLESGHWSMTELCERYGVTRPTGYKWLARHQASGGAGLADRSRAPQSCPHRYQRRAGDADRRRTTGVRLGREEAAPCATDPAPEPRVAGAELGQRDPRAARATAQESAPTEVGASWGGPDRDAASQSDLARGLQRPVPHRRRPVLLSADSDRSFQPPRAGVPRAALREDHRREAGLPRPVPRGGIAGRHPHRQRRAVRLDGPSRPGRTERLVDATRHRASAHHAGESARERHARANASRTQTRNGPSGGQQSPRTAAALRRLLPAIQRRAAARGYRRPHAELRLAGAYPGVQRPRRCQRRSIRAMCCSTGV